MDRTAARGLPRTCARVALIVAAFLFLAPAFVEAAAVTLEWDRNSDGITAGYFVLYGIESGKYSGTVDVGSSTSAVVNLSDPNATYYFAVQAYSATGEKSAPSTEVVWYQGTPTGGTPTGGTPTGGTPTGGTPTGGTPTGGTPSAQSPTLRNPGSMTTVLGQSANLQLSASDPGGLVLTYSAAGLPPGLAVGTGTGVISGIPSAPGAYIVIITVTNTSSLSALQTFTWTILNQPVSSGSPGGVPGGTIGGVPGGTGGTGGGTGGGVPGGTSGGGTGGGGGTSPIGGGGGTGTGGGTGSQTPVPTQDLTPPTVNVFSPAQGGGSARTTDSRVIVTGSASDNVGVVSVTWANSRGGSGAAFGTSSWATGPIDLSMGDNVITISAADAAGNVRQVTLTVTRYVDIQNFVN